MPHTKKKKKGQRLNLEKARGARIAAKRKREEGELGLSPPCPRLLLLPMSPLELRGVLNDRESGGGADGRQSGGRRICVATR